MLCESLKFNHSDVTAAAFDISVFWNAERVYWLAQHSYCSFVSMLFVNFIDDYLEDNANLIISHLQADSTGNLIVGSAISAAL